MAMTPGLRKFALTTHVTSSVGWVGAVAAFLALAIAGVGSQDAQIVRAAYLAMHLTTWFVIVPLCVAALSTGVWRARVDCHAGRRENCGGSVCLCLRGVVGESVS